MSTNAYHKRLQHDLVHWVKMGWVRPEHTDAILGHASQTSSTNKVPAIIGILGAILLASGVILFVSANWQEMSKLARLALLMGAMWASFGAAIWLNRTSHKYLLEAVMFLGVAIFGANIIMIAQIYHIDNHYPDGFLLWGAGGLLTAFLLKSRTALVLGFGLIIWWAGTEVTFFNNNPFWPFLPVWAAATALTVWLSNRFALHMAFLSIMAWIIASLAELIKLVDFNDTEFGMLAVLFILAFFVYGLVIERNSSSLTLDFGGALARYGTVALLLLIAAVQVSQKIKPEIPSLIPLVLIIALAAIVLLGTIILFRKRVFSAMDVIIFLSFATWFTLLWFIPLLINKWVVAVIILSLTIWLLTLAQKRNDTFLVAIALFAFGAEVLYLYVETLGTLLNTSLFFLLGGVLLIALSFGLEMLRRYLDRTRTAPQVAT